MHEDELVDRSATGKVRPWKQHKISNKKLIGLYEILNRQKGNKYESRVKRMQECADTLIFESCTNNPTHHKRLKKASFCKQRFCFICSWRKTLFIFHQFLAVAEHVIKKHPQYKFLLLTLTGRNCTGEELSQEITHYLESFRRMTRRKQFADNIKGFFRTVECTYNPETDTYHPHIHCILVVPSSYFKKGYIKQDEWTDLWRKSLRADYQPIVDIRKIKPKKQGVKTVQEEIDYMNQSAHDSALAAAGAEVAKYAVKMGDIIHPKPKKGDTLQMRMAKANLEKDECRQAMILDTLEDAMKNRRFIAYGGILKEAYKELGMVDLEKADLVNIGDEEKQCTCPVCSSELVQIQYVWNQATQAFLYNHIVPDRLSVLTQNRASGFG